MAAGKQQTLLTARGWLSRVFLSDGSCSSTASAIDDKAAGPPRAPAKTALPKVRRSDFSDVRSDSLVILLLGTALLLLTMRDSGRLYFLLGTLRKRPHIVDAQGQFGRIRIVVPAENSILVNSYPGESNCGNRRLAEQD